MRGRYQISLGVAIFEHPRKDLRWKLVNGPGGVLEYRDPSLQSLPNIFFNFQDLRFARNDMNGAVP